MDCRATATAPARNDDKTAGTNTTTACNDDKNGISKKVDSRKQAPESTFEHAQSVSQLHSEKAHILQSSNATNAARRQDLGDKNGALQADARAHTRAYVTAATAAESAKSAQNKRSGASVSSQVSLEKPTPKPSRSDSKILERESGLFECAQGRILGVCNRCARDEIHDSSPKAESPQAPL